MSGISHNPGGGSPSPIQPHGDPVRTTDQSKQHFTQKLTLEDGRQVVLKVSYDKNTPVSKKQATQDISKLAERIGQKTPSKSSQTNLKNRTISFVKTVKATILRGRVKDLAAEVGDYIKDVAGRVNRFMQVFFGSANKSFGKEIARVSMGSETSKISEEDLKGLNGVERALLKELPNLENEPPVVLRAQGRKLNQTKVLEKEFKTSDGRLLGKERIERYDTLPKQKEIQEAKLEHFARKLELDPRSETLVDDLQSKRESHKELVDEALWCVKQLKALDRSLSGQTHLSKGEKKRLNYLQTRIESLPDGDQKRQFEGELAKFQVDHARSWVGANFYRDAFKEALSDPTVDYDDAVRSIANAPINMRLHDVEGSDGANLSSMKRLGVISDLGYGAVNLADMKRALASKDFRQQEISRLKALGEEYQDNTGFQRQLASTLKFYSSESALEDAIATRERIMKDQVLQLLSSHAESGRDEKIRQNDTFDMVHVSYLNHNSQKLYSSGYFKNEENLIKDMKELFDDLDGKTVIFDGKGPYFDDNGNIHLPQWASGEYDVPLEKELKTFYANVTVQGYTKNDGVQKSVNDDFLEKMEKRITDPKQRLLLEGVKGGLESGESNYAIASDLSNLVATDERNHTSGGCFSAKDRTGVTLSYNAVRNVADRSTLSHLEKERFIEKEAKKITKPGHIAVTVAQECNRESVKPGVVTTLKSSALHLPGSKGDLRATASRIQDFIGLGIMEAQKQIAGKDSIIDAISEQIEQAFSKPQ